MNRKRFWSLGLIFVFLSMGSVSAQIQPTSRVLPFSGIMPGQPDGSVAIRLRLFPASTGGTFVFEETQTVDVAAETFSVFVGDATSGGIPSTVFANNASLWIALAMDATPDTEIGDRTPITSAGYAQYALTPAGPQGPPGPQGPVGPPGPQGAAGPGVTPGSAISGSTASPILTLTNTGGGNAGNFQISNALNSSNALFANTNGTGAAFRAMTTGTASAGLFEISNLSNSRAALEAATNGTGRAGVFSINNGNNISTALEVSTAGTGAAGLFRISNPGNNSTALDVFTNGTGPARSTPPMALVVLAIR